MRDWVLGADGMRSMVVPTTGAYGIEEGLQVSLPVRVSGGDYEIVEGLSIDAFSQERINVTLKELQEEQAGVKHLL